MVRNQLPQLRAGAHVARGARNAASRGRWLKPPMKIGGKPQRTIWLEDNGWSVGIIDQTKLPHAFVTISLRNVVDAAHAIRSMQVRGAPLIGATAAYAVA